MRYDTDAVNDLYRSDHIYFSHLSLSMSSARSKNVRTSADFKRQPMDVVKQARKTKLPVLITMQGKPGVVVVDAAVYQERLKVANLARLLEEGERDVDAGRLEPADEVLKELSRAKKVSR